MLRLLLWLMMLWPCGVLAASPVPTEIYAEVDHGLRAATVLADPEGYRGRILLLGGKVERTVSEPGQVVLEIACHALTEDDRPAMTAQSLGRALVTGGELDGAKLQPGRLLTLVGEVAGWGEDHLPLLMVKFVYPWPTAAEEMAAREAAAKDYRRYEPWCDPWYRDPWCDPWYYGPYPRWRFGSGYHRHWH